MTRRRPADAPTPVEELVSFAHESNRIEAAPTTGYWVDNHITAASAVDVSGAQGVLLPVQALHAMLFHHVWEDAGQYRKVRVVIGDGTRVLYRPPPPPLIEPLMKAWQAATIDLVYDGEGPFYTQWDIHHAFESIHPFRDGNGRVGRLALNNAQRAMRGYWIIVPYAERAEYYADIVAWRARPEGLKAFLAYANVSPWDGLELP